MLALSFPIAAGLLFNPLGAAEKEPPTAAPPAKTEPAVDLSEYRTIATAITTQINRASSESTRQSGYLGVSITPDKGGKLVITDIEQSSPATRAGLLPGDILVKLDGQALDDVEMLREQLQQKSPTTEVKLEILRQGKRLEISTLLTATSRPVTLSSQRVVIGVRLGDLKEGEGVEVVKVLSGLPASKAGLKSGDYIARIDGVTLTGAYGLNDALIDKQPGDIVSVFVHRKHHDLDFQLAVVADPNADVGESGWYNRTFWKKESYRLAVIPIEYPDVKHNPKIGQPNWEEEFFSKGKFVSRKNPTGQAVYGSVNDYYRELSCGKFQFTGTIFKWITLTKKRADYAADSTLATKTAFFNEVLEALQAREGADVLANFDGLIFLYAGERFPSASHGHLYWPHRWNVTFHGKHWPYVICPEGGLRMTSISLFCHELGHLLGLPDLYARPESPGQEGAGIWCAMSSQLNGGRPQHFCAWSKEQLDWLKPTLIDPTVKQKLILSPVEGSTNECYKILVRRDGSEYFLLENRRKKGFDTNLPGEGLMIWRVIHDKPVLEESHGIEGPLGPRVFLKSVPFPSAANNAFTPFTTPSSRSLLGGGLPVYITNIRQLPDGRITFYIGYEFE